MRAPFYSFFNRIEHNHTNKHPEMKKPALLITLYLFIAGFQFQEQLFAQINYPEIVGCPTDHSIVINVIVEPGLEFYYQYGTSSGTYAGQTETITAPSDNPVEVVIDDLSPNTRYYYRMKYSTDGLNWVERAEHSFHTQRAKGSSFVFTIIADTHAEFYDSDYQQAVLNVIDDQPDFHMDLGDTFMTDGDNSQSQVDNEYLLARDPDYMGGIGHSAPIFLASGNHENEEGWNFDDAFSIALASVQARKMYYPTPVPGEFYSGNEDLLTAIEAVTYGDQYREDYYAWEWGDALFVVIDPFQYTMNNPYGAMAGEGSDDPATGDRWNWSLGQEQFNWFRQTIENSNTKYKFVFAHHMLGGEQNYVREGAGPAHMFEWGGYNADGTTWGFTTKRPGWEEPPIHQLMIDNGVSAFFHGHDHQYAYQVRDGIVYQCVPRPSTGLDFNYYSESDQYTERVIGNAGHLRVTVTPEQTTVEYVRSNTSGVSHTYTIEPNEVSEPGLLGDVNADEMVNSTDALVVLSCDAGIDVSQFCPMDCGDLNGDGQVNSTDALIILSYDAGMSVPYAVGEPGCPSGVTPCAGCNP
jgi:hypothetical protein